MNLALLVPSWTGHMNPAFALRKELRARGHSVMLYTTSEMPSYITSLQGEQAAVAFIDWLAQANERISEHVISRKLDRYDVILADQALSTGAVMANVYDVPIITLCHALYRPSTTPINHPILQQIPEWFDLPDTSRPVGMHYSGPWIRQVLELGSVRYVNEPKQIYVSLGTLFNKHTWLYQLILDACADLPVRVVVSLGNASATGFNLKVPPNAKVLGYCNQLYHLRHSDLCITHAGLNTVMESMTFGIPMLMLPLVLDQHDVAARAFHRGVGEVLAVNRLGLPELQQTIAHILDNPSYTYFANKAADDLAAINGPELAVQAIEKICSNPTDAVIVNNNPPV